MRLNRGSGNPADLGLSINNSCQTLSNDLDIFKNTPQVSRVGQA